MNRIDRNRKTLKRNGLWGLAASLVLLGLCVAGYGNEIVVQDTKCTDTAYTNRLLLRCAFTVTNQGGEPIGNAVTVVRIPRQRTQQHWTHRILCSAPATIREDSQGNRELAVSTLDLAPFGNRTFTVGVELLTASVPVGTMETNFQAFLSVHQKDAGMEGLRAEVGNRTAESASATVSNLLSWAQGVAAGDQKTGLPPEVRRPRGGNCVHAAEIMAIACRTAGIPARQIDGYVSQANEVLSPFGYHSWVEYWDGKGWTPVDPSRGNFGHGACRGYIAFAVLPVAEESSWHGRFFWSETDRTKVRMNR